MDRSRRFRESQKLAQEPEMGHASSDVTVQLPIFNELGHYGTCFNRYSARSSVPVHLEGNLIAVDLSLGHCVHTFNHGSNVRGFRQITHSAISQLVLHRF